MATDYAVRDDADYGINHMLLMTKGDGFNTGRADVTKQCSCSVLGKWVRSGRLAAWLVGGCRSCCHQPPTCAGTVLTTLRLQALWGIGQQTQRRGGWDRVTSGTDVGGNRPD